jgi:hypothetical protein
MKTSTALIVLAALILLAGAGAVIWLVYYDNPNPPWPFRETYTTEHTEYYLPKIEPDDVLVDDTLDDKNPAFSPDLADPRPLGFQGEWLINNSAAVFRLDVPIIKPDAEPYLLNLHPSYKAAIDSYADKHAILPSVNLIDGKAKQFDDGLYAALDQAYYKGLKGKLLSHVALVQRIYEQAGKDSPAAPFLAAGLELAGVKVAVTDQSAKDVLLAQFNGNEVQSKPIGFYTWNDTLGQCFRFLRFFQRQLDESDLALIRALADALGKDKAVLADYQKAMTFYARLTNPYSCLTCADVAGRSALDSATLKRLCEQKKTAHIAVALFPPSTSKEVVLFEELFPGGLPPNADLMRELVRRIRSGEVDLKPKADSGWYEHQVYALETLLLPEKGVEREKVQLTKAYKKRMLEAFQALITKRRETHVRQLGIAEASSAPLPLDKVKPRLRVEPCPSYFLRTARAYAFLANFLEAALGAETLASLHGLKQGGERSADLHAELQQMRDLFYGLYLISAEDIGMKLDLAKDEAVNREHCTKLAVDWLSRAFDDPDLAMDTRVSVPIYADADPVRPVTRLWATLGVRLARLEVSYAKPPHLKPAKGDDDWKLAETHQLQAAEFLIPVDEFAEFELKGMHTLTREELRAVCDREQTKDRIVGALRR